MHIEGVRAVVKEIKPPELSNELIAKKKRRFWEYIVLAIVLAIAGFFLVQEGASQVRHFKELMLRHQIWRVRNAVVMYYSMFSSMPPDLVVLTQTKVVEPRSGVSFPILEGVKIGKKGFVVDTFGYPYDYDNQTGRVSSTAPCCKLW